MIAPARLAAYEALQAATGGRSDLATALARTRAALRDDRDKALASEIATGVERWRAALDFLIEQQAGRPVSRLDPEVALVLRMAIYQLLHLSRVPAAAAVDDAVSLTRKVGKGSAAGFVNAVLRGISRQRHTTRLPERPADSVDREASLRYLSLSLSHPEWLSRRWLDRLGLDKAEAWMQFNNRPAPLTLRAHPAVGRERLLEELADADVVAHPGAFAPDAVVIPAGSLGTAAMDPGAFVVQDEASQLIALLAGPRPGRRVLDTCASPGGKATALAAAAGNDGLVVAADLRPRRLALLARSVASAGAGNVRLLQMDLRQPVAVAPVFDTVLVDAPCSGLGTLRRDPDIKWRRLETDLAPFGQSQRQMLTHAAAAVRPGGRLIYATCSSEPEENEAVADAFLHDTPGFRAVDARGIHPALSDAVVDGRGHLRTTPHAHGLENFYGAVFERI